MRRGQLSLSLVEAGVGVLVVFAAVAGFAVGAPDAGAGRAQLDRYAGDAVTVLSDGAGAVSLSDIARSEESFDRNRTRFEARADALLPANVLYRVETPHGTVGYPVPDNRLVGTDSVRTRYGTVTIRVWFA